MKVHFIAAGTRGDVQPLVALALGFQQAGFEVTFATHSVFEALTKKWGLRYQPLAGNPEEAVRSDVGQEWISSGKDHKKGWHLFCAMLQRYFCDLPQSILNACDGADVLLFSPPGYLTADVAEMMKIKHAAAFCGMFPIWSSSAMSALPGMWPNWTKRLGSLLSHRLATRGFWGKCRNFHNQWRDKLRLAPIPSTGIFQHLQRRAMPAVYACSKIFQAQEWPTHQRCTGYWFLDEVTDFSPARAIEQFISSGDPPIYIGFGSMVPESIHTVVTELARGFHSVGMRTIVSSGWSQFEQSDFRAKIPSSCLIIDYLPHSWLFPRMALAVHHGGNHTTGAVFHAGIPSIIVPFIADQPLWAAQVKKREIGDCVFHWESHSAKKIVDKACRLIASKKVATRVANLKQQVIEEYGVTTAVKSIIELLRL